MTKPKKKARTDMRTYLHIVQLKFECHLSNRQIALNLNIGSSTVNDILVRFKSLNLPWPLPAHLALDELDKALMSGRSYATNRILPSWLSVDMAPAKKGVAKQLLWQ